MVSAKRVVGMLSLGNREPKFFTVAQQRQLEMLAAPIALWMQNTTLLIRNHAGRAPMHRLTQELLNTQEEERKRVSRELHDEAGQSLTALTANLELLQQDLSGQSQALIDRARVGGHDASNVRKHPRAGKIIAPARAGHVGLEWRARTIVSRFRAPKQFKDRLCGAAARALARCRVAHALSFYPRGADECGASRASHTRK